jgi:hypothetical protein
MDFTGVVTAVQAGDMEPWQIDSWGPQSIQAEWGNEWFEHVWTFCFHCFHQRLAGLAIVAQSNRNRFMCLNMEQNCIYRILIEHGIDS